MPTTLELECDDCKIIFELYAKKKKINPDNVLCPDCASNNVRVRKEKDSLGIRIDNLIKEVSSLSGRVIHLEEFLNDMDEALEELGLDDSTNLVPGTDSEH